MSDPFKITGPAVINFSGGRTSGRLLWECAQRGLDDDVFVVFNNTARERQETYAFVERVEREWLISVVWLERMPRAELHALHASALGQVADDEKVEGSEREREVLRLMARRVLEKCWREVAPSNSARDGSVFEQLINERGYLPNPVTRYCTTELKTLTTERWMRSRGFDHWTEVMGLRADEPHRVARMRGGAGRKYRDVVCPLADAGIDRAEVERWWTTQSFDLGLRPWEGNCDLCHLKGISKVKRILLDNPELAEWWVRMESKQRPKARVQTFRSDRPSYQALLDLVQEAKAMQPTFAFLDEPETDLDDLGDCVCSGAA